MNAAFDGHCFTSTGEGADLAVRALRLITSVQNKLGDLERPGVSPADVIFGRCTAKLAELPIADLEATATKLQKHLDRHGCSVVRVSGEDHQLTSVLQQLRSTLEQLAPYLPHVPK